MKTFKLLAGAAALLAMSALAACSSDEPIGTVDPGQAEADETRFLAVQISTPNEGSRADYEVGSKNESKINTLDFIFYDINGNVTASVQHLEYVSGTGTAASGKFNDSNLNDGTYEPITGDSSTEATDYNVNRIWHSVVPVNLVQGQNLPSYVLCLVNATSATVNSVVSDGNMSALRDNNNPLIYVEGGFVMSNSVYFGTNELTGQTNQRMSATPIKAETQLFATSAAAQAAITALSTPDASSAAVVDIYVERKAAKVGLTMAKNAVKEYELPYYTTVTTGEGEESTTTTPTVKLTFVPEYWFVNATAENVYLTKRYMLPNEPYAEWSSMNSAFTGTAMASTWNAPRLHRSFWGCSPSYYVSSYPLVSDDVNDLDGNTTDYDENYYSYEQVSQGTSTSGSGLPISIAATRGDGLLRSFAATQAADGSVSNGYLYTLETTTASSIITDTLKNPAATVASAVIVGHYHVQVGDGEVTEMSNSVFYVQPNVNEGKGAYFPTVEAVQNYLASSQRTLFADQNGRSFASTSLSEYIVEHPKKAVRDAMTASGVNGNLAGYIVALQLKSVPTNTVYYYNGTTYEAVTASNLAKVNAALYQNGSMNVYNHGRAFFNIPIRHLGFNGDNGNNNGAQGNLIDANGKLKWGAMKIGDLGVVRNHVYNMTVSQISGLGTGLRADDQPIVPAKDDLTQYVAMRLNVLEWRVVPSWTVSL